MQWRKLSVRSGDRKVEVYIFQEKENVYRIRIDDREYIVEVTRKSFAVSNTYPRIELRPGELVVVAEIPGRIVDVYVKEGDFISEGNAIVVIESMKMEIEITSPRKGVVEKIFVSKGSFVNVGDPLIKLRELNQ
ncbi:acetyl-CoA carboxylase biotin carboxyl carrier protein subunit [Ignisphaera sp. 4213-co]|uniref:Acetyl-CoA carboxylase biotin carboxyl carrier protein subunit n=1 Tax=Ignisphaera cupida TaxID=3050454 RepID=A0ABD4Z778_9CREN|nr:acetyl-CoA carboxylase biotin carboxyl carrier protein subunit [Ignisphaera sp. 4213-co]MDK6028165.1 acetyl-CoA carboxylase biotin carboxyl carrier protein subunit [Ignisphaera sp. 4213-co]